MDGDGRVSRVSAKETVCPTGSDLAAAEGRNERLCVC